MRQQVERQLIESTLRRCDNHRDRAAKQLGLARSSVFKRLKEWGLRQGGLRGTGKTQLPFEIAVLREMEAAGIEAV